MATAAPRTPGKLFIPPPPTSAELMANSALATGSPASPTNLFGNVPLPKARRVRPSFSTIGRTRRSSTAALEDDEDNVKSLLPTLVPGIRPAYSTPLPFLPMMVLCIAMLSELLAANLCTPFLLKLVEGFFVSSGAEKNSETEAQVGLWTGNLVSVFFITQFFTSLLWSSIADRHGRRAVLVASLTGSAIALIVFGTSESLSEAICVRLVQGIFGGAVGVFRGSIRDITDDTNATRAYAVLGFSWGFGGVVGPILGGVFESPADNFPGTFLSHIGLLQSFPYLLPTVIGGMILLCGAVLSCFLSWDGGVRGGSRIALPIEKNEPLESAPKLASSPALSHRTAVPTLRGQKSVPSPGTEDAAHGAGYPAFASSVPHNRRDSRASLGTAYGLRCWYGGIRSKHPTLAARAAVDAARRASAAVRPFDPSEEDNSETSPALGFAQKLLLANEENTFNINDLWVSAAVAQDTSVFDDIDDEDEETNDDAIDNTPQQPQVPTPGSGTMEEDSLRGSFLQRRMTRNRIASGTTSTHRMLAGHRLSVSQGGRRFSTSSGIIPAIFANTGLTTPPVAAADSDPFSSPATERRYGALSAIAERPGTNHLSERSPLVSPGIEETKAPSTWNSLPLSMIVQYGMLALHGTIHDQIFLSFLVTPYKSGGIGLNPASFSFLIALMCLFQLLYQFYLYPRLGPPLGKFSHLQMFRIGCALYVPAYMALPFVHRVASAEKSGGLVVMTLVTMITALRYCGGTFAYTAVMILINAMSPPHVVGLANGLAQSTVSFSRFVGPVIGGAVWSASINGNPSGYHAGFYVVTLACIVQWSLSFLIR